MMFIIFGSAFGGPLRWMAPIALVVAGLLLIVRGVQAHTQPPRE
jgi:hypothetical protein